MKDMIKRARGALRSIFTLSEKDEIAIEQIVLKANKLFDEEYEKYRSPAAPINSVNKHLAEHYNNPLNRSHGDPFPAFQIPALMNVEIHQACDVNGVRLVAIEAFDRDLHTVMCKLRLRFHLRARDFAAFDTAMASVGARILDIREMDDFAKGFQWTDPRAIYEVQQVVVLPDRVALYELEYAHG